MNVHSVSARLAAALVALIAGAASWEHIASVAAAAGERPWVAYSLPAAIDGLILVGVAALLEDRRGGRVPRASARLAVAVGVLATLCANVASAEPTWTARLVAVAAPVSFLLSVEVLTRVGKARSAAATGVARGDHGGTSGNAVRATESPQKRPGGTGSQGKRPRRTTAERVVAAVARSPDATPATVAGRLKISERTVQRHWPVPPVDVVSPNGDRQP